MIDAQGVAAYPIHPGGDDRRSAAVASRRDGSRNTQTRQAGAA